MKFLPALVRRRFAGEPVVVGHSQANRQSILKLSTHCFFCSGIISYVTLYHCYRVMLQVLQTDLFPQKIVK